MLGLKLRDEFLGAHMPGTAIALRTSDNQGAAQKSPDHILSITYPTADVQTALKAISVKNTGRPIVLMGDRGRGKSHIMAVMHHGIQSPEVVETWLQDWGSKIRGDELKNAEMLKGYVPISEPVHNHEYPLLWDLLFDRHLKGQYYRGQFESMSQPFPPRTLLEKMFEDQPTCLILDEFQTWYMGLPDKDPKTGLLLKQYAFNFVQILSEIAKDRPEILIFVISVLNNQNDAFQQVHRQGPVIVDFRGPSAKQDRQKLLLHRLFENRRNISEPDIINTAGAYANERFRLLHINKTEAEKARVQQEAFACWPFSPELLELIEDHILLSSAAQETRDLIRILAQVYRTRGDLVPIITPADFFVDGESDEVQTLVDAIAVQAGQERLREIAQRNLEAIRDAGVKTPNARELVSAIWMRSMSPGKNTGGTPAALHLDITRGSAIDDNAFQAELCLLIENSFNIHGDEVPGGPLWFRVSENPRSKVRACAKNNKLWHIGAAPTAGLTVYPGKDVLHIRNTLRHIFVPETTSPPSRVIIFGPNWKNDPWGDVDEADRPAKWDRPVLLVVPDQIEGGPAGVNSTLGAWLAKHVQKRRNTIRFLLPAVDTLSLFSDEELIYSARCSFLCSREGWGSDATYRALHQDFDRLLRASLKSRFNRFAVLRKWDFQEPRNCVFDVEKITGQGGEIPAAIEAKILSDLFDQTEFKQFVLKRAKDSDFVGSMMDDLIEPPPPNAGEAIPFLGETKIYEFVLDIAAGGDLVLNVGGTWIGRRSEDATDEDALRHIRGKAFRTGQEMRQIQLGLPGAVGGGTVTVPNVPAGGATKPGSGGILIPGPTVGYVSPYPPITTDDETVVEIGDPGADPVTEEVTPPAPISEIKNRKSEEPATEAPDDPNEAAKLVWDHYYCNHQKAGSFKHLKVLDCFMGGGTTLVEGSRLGMEMTGVDLNPVAWFVVKNELACSDPEQVKALFEEIERQVKPQIQPFYTTTCPRGHQGRWIDVETGEPVSLDPIESPPEQRSRYRWEGPEVIYTFWAKHGPCQAKGCGHRTPIFRTPVIAEKKLSTGYAELTCPGCGTAFHAELGETRMAPGAERVVVDGNVPFTELTQDFARMLNDYDKGNANDTWERALALKAAASREPGLHCPGCGAFAGKRLTDVFERHAQPNLRNARRKKKDFALKRKPVQMYLLIHPEWMKGHRGLEVWRNWAVGPVHPQRRPRNGLKNGWNICV